MCLILWTKFLANFGKEFRLQAGFFGIFVTYLAYNLRCSLLNSKNKFIKLNYQLCVQLDNTKWLEFVIECTNDETATHRLYENHPISISNICLFDLEQNQLPITSISRPFQLVKFRFVFLLPFLLTKEILRINCDFKALCQEHNKIWHIVWGWLLSSSSRD